MVKDYCTGVPDGILGYDWWEKCQEHDRDYWYSGIDRKVADIKLREGMKEKLPTHLHFIAWIYYFGVRIIGGLFWKELN